MITKKRLSLAMVLLMIIGMLLSFSPVQTYAATVWNDWTTVNISTMLSTSFGSGCKITDIGQLSNGNIVAIISRSGSFKGTLVSANKGVTWSTGFTFTGGNDGCYAYIIEGNMYIYDYTKPSTSYKLTVYKSMNGTSYSVYRSHSIPSSDWSDYPYWSYDFYCTPDYTYRASYGDGNGLNHTMIGSLYRPTSAELWYRVAEYKEGVNTFLETDSFLQPALWPRTYYPSYSGGQSQVNVYKGSAVVASVLAQYYSSSNHPYGLYAYTVKNGAQDGALYMVVEDSSVSNDGSTVPIKLYRVTSSGSLQTVYTVPTGDPSIRNKPSSAALIGGIQYITITRNGNPSNQILVNGVLQSTNINPIKIAGDSRHLYAIDQNGSAVHYKVLSNSPTINVIAPSQNGMFGQPDSSFVPSISVSDPDNETLTCKYYIDTELTPRQTKTVTNTSALQTVNFTALNMNTLSEASHTMRFEVWDNVGKIESSVSFIVDKTPPVIGTITRISTSDSITVSGTATDSYLGLDPNPYRFTVGTYPATAWGTATSYPKTGLIPNTPYSVKFEARDKAKNVLVNTQNIYTKAQIPILKISNPKINSLDVSATDDANPDTTHYQIKCGTQYVSSTGALTTTAAWITLTGKKITVTGLSPNTTYSIQARARTSETTPVETVFCVAKPGTTLVTVPTGITTTPTNTSITVKWSAVTGATGYDVEVNGSVVNNGTSLTYPHGGLAAQTTHKYRVRAKSAAGLGDWSAYYTATTKPNPPTTPTNLSATRTNTTITVNWDTVSGADSYEIKADGAATPVSTGTSTTYVHSGLTPDSEHRYQVRAVNTGGEGTYSSELKLKTLPNIPAIPSNFKGTATNRTITLSWDAVSYAAVYDIEINGQDIENTTATSHALSGLQPNTQYRFKVRATNIAGEGDWTAEIVVKTLPDAPQSVPVLETTATNNKITVTWNAVEGAEGYDIKVDNIENDNGANTTYEHTNLGPNETHTYCVRAKNAGGIGNWSEPKTATTKPNVPEKPQNIQAGTTDKEITLTWDAVTGAESYDIEINSDIKGNVTVTEYVYGGLTPNTEYTYRVRGVNETGAGDWSDAGTATTKRSVPAVPANIQATATRTTIKLDWDDVPYADSYDIEINSEIKDNITVTEYVYGELRPNEEYTYRIRAINDIGTGAWSELNSIMTIGDLPGIPQNVKAEADREKVTITWDAAEKATGYEVELDGLIVDNGAETISIHNGLIPGSEHSYRVRAKNEDGPSPWSERITVKTYLLNTPVNVKAAADINQIRLTWDAVAGAEGYDIEINSAIADSVTVTEWVYGGLTPDQEYSIRVRAKKGEDSSNWSTLLKIRTGTVAQNIPKNIAVVSGKSKVTVVWEGIVGAEGYDIEIDGAVADNENKTSYTHSSLQTGSSHTYRIRSRSPWGTSEWSTLITAETLPGAPEVPVNVKTEIKDTAVKVTWDAVVGVTGYDIEVDGSIIDNGNNNSYLHTGLKMGTGHTYRVRAKNAVGSSKWSEAVILKTTSPTYTVEGIQNEYYNLVLLAEETGDVSQKLYIVSYNSTELEAVDLCSLTGEKEMAVGKIAGTNVEILEHTAGRIVFKATAAINPNDSWSGILNSIKFRSKVNGTSTVTYKVQ